MRELYFNIVVEDDIHEALLQKVFKYVNPRIIIANVYGKKGNEYIKKSASSFNSASVITPHVILTDLDDNQCAVTLINDWINFEPHSSFLFRVAVEEGETWLLSDKTNFAHYIGVSEGNFKHAPELINNPKEYIINLISNKSRKRKIREDILPIGSSRIGPSYNSCMVEFIQSYWSVESARQNSSSLNKLIIRVEELSQRLINQPI